MNDFNRFPPEAKTWIYQANRPFTPDEETVINKRLQNFLEEWTSHGQKMKAHGELVHHLFIIIMADESASSASGCGIDESVRFIKNIEALFQVDLFNRMNVAYRTGEGIRIASRDALSGLLEQGEIDADTIIFNNMITTKKEWQDRWEVPVKDSWVATLMSQD